MKEKHLIDAPGKHFAARAPTAHPEPGTPAPRRAGPNHEPPNPRTPTLWLSRDSSTIFDDPATMCVIAAIFDFPFAPSVFPLFT